MIDRVFQTVKIVLNTDGRGNVSPNDYEVILHSVVLERFEELFNELKNLLNRQNRGLTGMGMENMPDQYRQKIGHYIAPAVALVYSVDSFAVPTDAHYFDTLLYNGNTIIEPVYSNKEFEIVKTQDPEEDFPVYLRQGNTITVAPSSIIANVTMSYLRKPLYGKWTYSEIDDVEIFNPSAVDYQDIDVHPSEETEIMLGVLKKFGMNLKESDVQAIIQREETMEYNEKNTN